MTPTAQRAGFVTGGRQLSGSASACAQTQAESAVKPGGLRCVAGTQASRREVHRWEVTSVHKESERWLISSNSRESARLNKMDLVKAHELTKYNFVKFMIPRVKTSPYKLDPSSNEKWEEANFV